MLYMYIYITASAIVGVHTWRKFTLMHSMEHIKAGIFDSVVILVLSVLPMHVWYGFHDMYLGKQGANESIYYDCMQ
jgi:hypothetical protein